MILVDTPVWIRFFSNQIKRLMRIAWTVFLFAAR